jgi:hypothetical protein
MDWYTAHMLVDYAREILTRQIQGWTGVPLLLGEWSLAHGAHPVYNTSEVGIIYTAAAVQAHLLSLRSTRLSMHVTKLSRKLCPGKKIAAIILIAGDRTVCAGPMLESYLCKLLWENNKFLH